MLMDTMPFWIEKKRPSIKFIGILLKSLISKIYK